MDNPLLNIDIAICKECGGAVKVIASIVENGCEYLYRVDKRPLPPKSGGLLWQVYYWWLLLIPKFINFPLHGQDISPKETLVGTNWAAAFGHKRTLAVGSILEYRILILAVAYAER